MKIVTTFSPDPNKISQQIAMLKSWLFDDNEVHIIVTPSDDVSWISYDEYLKSRIDKIQLTLMDNLSVKDILFFFKDTQFILVNGDIECRDVYAIKQIYEKTEERNALTYLCRWNYDGNYESMEMEKFGIDTFIVPVNLWYKIKFPHYLVLGKPLWDYFLPLLTLRSGYDVYYSHRPITVHKRHKKSWNGVMWRSMVDLLKVDFNEFNLPYRKFSGRVRIQFTPYVKCIDNV